jgi:HD-GYP domain-containing protein (c-di-GMP phosphodiesterase class II)/DNA-binding CsgD family transcriptional regulator
LIQCKSFDSQSGVIGEDDLRYPRHFAAFSICFLLAGLRWWDDNSDASADHGEFSPSFEPPAMAEAKLMAEPERSTSLADMLCALSFVADIGMGQRIEHGLRSAYIGLEICRNAGLSHENEEAVFYGALLKDAGCTACAGVFAVLFGGDDLGPREDCLLLRPDHVTDAISWFWKHSPQDASLPARMTKLFSFMTECRGVMTEGVTAHCEIGRMYCERLGLPDTVGEAVHYSWERWDGKNMGYHLKGDAIPLTARVLHAAQTVEAAYTFGTKTAAIAMTKERRGSAFDPEIADVVLRLSERPSFWSPLAMESTVKVLMAMRPVPAYDALDAAQVDGVCEVLADFADAKCRRTWHHSEKVAAVAREIALEMRLGQGEATGAWRAGLVHDIGKAAVPVGILEKGDFLSNAEMERFRAHPSYTETVLSRIEPLRSLAPIAGAHHEQLDGNGYPKGVLGSELGLHARILATADRCVLAHAGDGIDDRSMADLLPLAGSILDVDCVAALRRAIGSGRVSEVRQATNPGKLTDREVEVLRLVAEGLTARDIAEQLVISRKTAEHHMENIYNKLGVTSKTAAAVYAVTNGLI